MASLGIRKIFRMVVYMWKNWCTQNVRKAQEWGGIISEVKKNIDLNKLQRSNGEWHRTKSFSKGKMIRNDGL